MPRFLSGNRTAKMSQPSKVQEGPLRPILKTLVFTVLVPGTVTVLVPYGLLEWKLEWSSLETRHLGWLGLPLVALGALGLLWCAWHFAVTGRGTPAPLDPPKLLVVRGLYRVTRNPMYGSVLTILLGESLVFASWILLAYATALWCAFNLFVVLHEEPTLRKRFGPPYEEYCRRVPRWIPRVQRGKAEGRMETREGGGFANQSQ